MRKTLTAVAAAATIGVATVAAPTTADARWGWWGPALGAFAVGAIVGGALARPYYSGGYYGGYYGGYAPAYYGGYYDDPYPVVRYRRVIRPAYAYYGGPRFYGPRYYRPYWRRW